jgi:hypothetical protein
MPPVAAGQAPPPPVLTCDGLEVTQAGQRLPLHDVPLVADKTTVVRVYLSAGAEPTFQVRGTLAGRPTGGAWQLVPSLNAATIDPADAGILRAKREELDKGLNFVLPPNMTAAGSWEFKLSAVERVDPAATLTVPAGAERVGANAVTFDAGVPLRVHVVGIRYQTSPGSARIAPRPLDLALIQSWLGRAYPVASVVWTTLTIDFPLLWPFTAAQVNAEVRTIRARDVAGGVDNRTHYYGLVYEGTTGNFMRGLASVPTGGPDPTAVGSGPTGTGRFAFNVPASYGDWYTGHELGHTFGREHANFCGAAGGGPYPHPNGQISPISGEYVGFDVGDATTGQLMQPLRGAPPGAGQLWHDVMTYCPFQWVSAFTYNGLLTRLKAEDALGPLPPPPPAGASPPPPVSAPGIGGIMTGSIHVVATVNLTQRNGRMISVVPYPQLPPTAPPARGQVPFAVQLLDAATAQPKGTYAATFIPDTCRDWADETGTIDVRVPNLGNIGGVQVLANQVVVAEYIKGMAPEQVRDIQPAAAGVGASAAGLDDPVVTWVDDAPARAGAGAGKPPRYFVDASTDGGSHWRTVGVNLTTPEVTLDRSLLAGTDKILLRVVSTDGFDLKEQVATLRTADL